MFRLAGLRQLSHRFPSVRAVLLLAAVMIVATVVATAVLLAELRQEYLRRAQGEIVTLTRVLAEQTTRTFEGVSLTLHGIKERLSTTSAPAWNWTASWSASCCWRAAPVCRK